MVWLGAVVVMLLIAPSSSCQAGDTASQTVEVEVRGVRMDYWSRSPVVILEDKNHAKAIPIWIGAFEAQAIDMEMRGTAPPRPLTHDLLKNILQDVGVVFEKAVVSELKGNTYYARVHLSAAGGKRFEVDCRPSDAIALALRFRKPIFVAKTLLERETAIETRALGAGPSVETVKGITVQNLTEDLVAYFGLEASGGGVVVSDTGGRPELVRGDVILAVGDERVLDVADFRRKMASVSSKGTTLRVRRGSEELGIEFSP
jgi:hypothetical protein